MTSRHPFSLNPKNPFDSPIGRVPRRKPASASRKLRATCFIQPPSVSRTMPAISTTRLADKSREREYLNREEVHRDYGVAVRFDESRPRMAPFAVGAGSVQATLTSWVYI